jgi:hypothetical protein
MKAALEPWGSNSNLFHQGVAKEVDDPDIIAASMLKPGVFIGRPTRLDASQKRNIAERYAAGETMA